MCSCVLKILYFFPNVSCLTGTSGSSLCISIVSGDAGLPAGRPFTHQECFTFSLCLVFVALCFVRFFNGLKFEVCIRRC